LNVKYTYVLILNIILLFTMTTLVEEIHLGHNTYRVTKFVGFKNISLLFQY